MSNGPIARSVAGEALPTDRLELLWRNGERPDPYAFLDAVGPCSLGTVTDVLALDQWLRWQAGERIPAEDYLRQRPGIADDPETAVQLIYGEFLVRKSLGERPEREEYTRRFPRFTDRLRQQFELHRALETDLDLSFRDSLLPTGTEGSGFEKFPSHSETETARPSAQTLPDPFGRYRIVKVLGSGGMGTVYLAEDTRLTRVVALKVPRFDATRDAELVERFGREARIAATFHHPNLCPVYDVGVEGGIHFLTMPVLRGEPLSALLSREGPLPQRSAARLVCSVAHALHEAHRAQVIHRDLKPSNIMVDERGEPIVMDFGLARRSSGPDPSVTGSGLVIGTPLYTPPEQIYGGSEHSGTRGDIYSLGVVLYEMLTGRVPFLGQIHQVLEQILIREPDPPSRLRSDLDVRLETICLTAIAKVPEERFASMAEFAAALEGYLSDKTEPGTPPVSQSADPLPHRNQRVRWAIVGFVVMAFTGLFGAFLWNKAGGGHFVWATPQAPDLLRVGSRWAGFAHFGPPYNGTHDTQFTVQERHGDDFKAICSNEEGTFVWEISGTIKDGKIKWGWIRVIKELHHTGIVGQGFVEGTCQGEKIEATYTDPESSAKLELFLK
jgi:serine/threonine protein kinase